MKIPAASSASVWLLNLDADDELALPSHTPRRHTLAKTRDLASALSALFGPGDTLLDGAGIALRTTSGHLECREKVGRSWCPTPRAVRLLERTGVTPVAGPDLAVLRRVNHKRFWTEVGSYLPEAEWLEDPGALAHKLEASGPTERWLLRRPYGFAGRGRRIIRRGALDEADRAWAEGSLSRSHGLLVVPWMERVADFAIHGFIRRAGSWSLGEPTLQCCDEHGVWTSSSRATTELTRLERDKLTETAHHVAGALVGEGYFGPFGIDAFRYRLGKESLFCACCEINARYSMGWAIGMGDRRPDLALGEDSETPAATG